MSKLGALGAPVVVHGGGIDLVCVNPMLVHRGREEEDFTRDRSDFKDSVIIAKRAAELRCYVPYQLDGQWARCRR